MPLLLHQFMNAGSNPTTTTHIREEQQQQKVQQPRNNHLWRSNKSAQMQQQQQQQTPTPSSTPVPSSPHYTTTKAQLQQQHYLSHNNNQIDDDDYYLQNQSNMEQQKKKYARDTSQRSMFTKKRPVSPQTPTATPLAVITNTRIIAPMDDDEIFVEDFLHQSKAALSDLQKNLQHQKKHNNHVKHKPEDYKNQQLSAPKQLKAPKTGLKSKPSSPKWNNTTTSTSTNTGGNNFFFSSIFSAWRQSSSKNDVGALEHGSDSTLKFSPFNSSAAIPISFSNGSGAGKKEGGHNVINATPPRTATPAEAHILSASAPSRQGAISSDAIDLVSILAENRLSQNKLKSGIFFLEMPTHQKPQGESKKNSEISLDGILRELGQAVPNPPARVPSIIVQQVLSSSKGTHIQVYNEETQYQQTHMHLQQQQYNAMHPRIFIDSGRPPLSPNPLQRGLSRSLSREFESKRFETRRTEFVDTHLRSATRHIVETNRVYSRKDQGNSVISPLSGAIEYSEGKINQFHLFETIGDGAYGKVVRALDEITQEYFACKIISKSRLMKKFRWAPGGDEQKMMKIRQEVAVLKKVSNHSKIIRLVEVLDDEADENLYLLMSIQIGHIITPFPESQAREYFRDVLLGLEFLHVKGIIHCDLKPENILLTSNGTVQIGDFGISTILDDVSKNDKIENQNTSPLYTSPAALTGDNKHINGKAADIWALGVCLYCFTHGHCPFEDEDVVSLYDKISTQNPVYKDTISKSCKDLLEAMLVKNPHKRITTDKIRIHTWTTEAGKRPLPSKEENCPLETVTPEDIEGAFKPAHVVISKMMNILGFKKSVDNVAPSVSSSQYSSTSNNTTILSPHGSTILSQTIISGSPPKNIAKFGARKSGSHNGF